MKFFITFFIISICKLDNSFIKEIKIQYTYDEEYKNITDKFTKMTKFSPNGKSADGDVLPSDFEYYEDNVLKMKNKYSKVKGTYVSQVFFDDGYSVKSYFEKEKRIKDVYTINGEIKRVKNYE